MCPEEVNWNSFRNRSSSQSVGYSVKFKYTYSAQQCIKDRKPMLGVLVNSTYR